MKLLNDIYIYLNNKTINNNKMIIPLVYDLNVLLLEYLDIFRDFKNLMLVNKFCKSLVEKNKLYISFEELKLGKKDSHDVIFKYKKKANNHPYIMFKAIEHNKINIFKYYLDNKKIKDTMWVYLYKIYKADNLECFVLIENNNEYIKLFNNDKIANFLEIIRQTNDYGPSIYQFDVKIMQYFVDKYFDKLEISEKKVTFTTIATKIGDIKLLEKTYVKDLFSFDELMFLLHRVFDDKKINRKIVLKFLFEKYKSNKLKEYFQSEILNYSYDHDANLINILKEITN